jgi:hypothetical protein
MKKFLLNMEIENIASGIMVFIVVTTLIVSFCFTPKCSHCGSFVNTAFCTKCGSSNEKYKEPVVENVTGLTCPICNVECHTRYCGDCGSEIVFVDTN